MMAIHCISLVIKLTFIHFFFALFIILSFWGLWPLLLILSLCISSPFKLGPLGSFHFYFMTSLPCLHFFLSPSSSLYILQNQLYHTILNKKDWFKTNFFNYIWTWDIISIVFINKRKIKRRDFEINWHIHNIHTLQYIKIWIQKSCSYIVYYVAYIHNKKQNKN